VNARLAEKPEGVNSDPHNSWMIAIKPSDGNELNELLDATAYAEHTK
jgi:glycine cleavage system H lipoate-binding protein